MLRIRAALSARDLADATQAPRRITARFAREVDARLAERPLAPLQLQRTVGNRATTAVLARQPEGATATPAAPAEAAVEVGAPVSPDELIGPVSAALEGITAVQFAEWWGAIEGHLAAPGVPRKPTPVSLAFPALYEKDLVERLGKVPATQRTRLVDGVKAATKQDVRTLVAERVVRALQEFGGLDYKNSWPAIRAQIVDPKPLPEKPRQRTGLQNAFTRLWEAPLLDELTAIGALDREFVADRAQKGVVKRIADAPLKTVTEEWAQLDAFVRNNIEKGQAGYVACRVALMEKFGSVEGINAYYREIKQVDFLGRTIWVHTAMAERLDAAMTLLATTKSPSGETWTELARASLRTAWGTNIRENRNSPTQLSDHSFGWAIDINAPTNPNTKKEVFKGGTRKNPLGSPVEELTGVDLFGGEEFTEIRGGGTAAELLPHAEAMREASSEYEQAFDSESALTDALAEYLRREGLLTQPWMKDDLWPTLELSAKERRLSSRLAKLGEWIQFLWDTREHEEPISIDEPAMPGMCLPESELEPADDSPDAICEPEDLPPFVVDPIARTLASAHSAFIASRDRKGKEVPASAVGSVGTIAQHGFLDLAPELIAALRGTDGGDLTWLGVARNTKDFMHFELQAKHQPPIVKIPPAGKAED